MFARVTRFEGFTEQADEAVRVAREQFIPAAQRSGGFEGMYILVDHESGNALSLTLWKARMPWRPASSRRIVHARTPRGVAEGAWPR